ncbi:MAG: sugar-binding domain-containing protein [Armatimonadota bacterium]
MQDDDLNRSVAKLLQPAGSEPSESHFSELDIESVVVAYYAIELDMSYEEIERMMGLSRATVARRLLHAKTMGWILPPRLRIPPALKTACERRVHCLDLEEELERLFRAFGLRKATVVLDKRVRNDGAYEVTQRVGQAAAARLMDALDKRARSAEPDRIVIGINWGYSTRWVVQYLSPQESENPDLAFVPLIGNLSVDERRKKEYEEAWLCSANRLARLASEKFQSGDPRRLTTPAIIPRKFLRDKQKLEAAWELIEEDASYKRIFGAGHRRGGPAEEDTLIGRMDTIVTGMSALEPTSSLVDMAHLLEPGELEPLKEAGYVGDLCGHLIYDPEKKVSNPNAVKLARALGELVVSARPEDFKAVAERAAASDDPWKGVFMIGRGLRKAAALVAACRMRAVTEIFTDSSTAEVMIELMGGKACPQ